MDKSIMVYNENYEDKLNRQYKDTIKYEVFVKDFKEIHDFLKIFEKKLNKLIILDIKVSLEINWRDKSWKL